MWWAAIMKIFGSGLGAYGALKQGGQEHDLLMERRNLYYRTASLLDADAGRAEEEGKVQETRHRQQVTDLIGAQRVAYAKSGVQMGSGTAALQEDADSLQGELDALLIRYNAQTKANALREQAINERIRGDMDAERAANAKENSRMKAWSTMLGGAGSTTGMDWS